MGKVGSSSIAAACTEAGLKVHHIHSLSAPLPAQSVVVTAVREPIARNLSAFFQNIDVFCPGVDDPQSVLNTFVTKYPHRTPEAWFDWEFRDRLGVDIYRHPFDVKRRYAAISDPRAIVLRVDCDDDEKSAVLSQAFGTEVTVRRENVGAVKKSSGALYRDVLDIARFDSAFLDAVYGSKYVKHFWSAGEIAGFKRRWAA